MDLARKLVPLALAGLAAAGLTAFSPAASATSTFLECNPQTVSGQNYAVCGIYRTATPPNSTWYYKGIHLVADDNLTFVRIPCGATGGQYSVHVTYTSSAGVPTTGDSGGQCGGRPV